VLPTQTNAGLANDRAVHRALLAIARQVPIAESRLEIGDLRAGHRRDPLDVTALLKSAVQLGHDLSFRVIDLAGTRVVLRLRDLTAAHTAYRIAVRTVRKHGAATLDGIAGQTRTTCHTNIDAAFVEGLLSGFATFRWLDREGGWFLFVERANPLLAKVRKVLSVVTRLSLVRFAAVLARAGAGLRPSPAVVRGLCVDVPEARIKDGVVVVDRPLDRRAHLNEDETRVVRFLEASGGAMTDAQLRWRVRQIGLAWTPVWRLLHSSPLFERPSHGMFRLVGSG